MENVAENREILLRFENDLILAETIVGGDAAVAGFSTMSNIVMCTTALAITVSTVQRAW